MPVDIAAVIRTQFDELGVEFVAVRSSATAEDGASAAWAGQLDTYLNTTSDVLIETVQKCWASLFTPRAIFYRHERGMRDDAISVAVVIQKMVQSEVSGIAFSVHPVTEDHNQLIIEAGFGLGEAVVSGQITPDSFVVSKQPRHIVDRNIVRQSRALWRAGTGGNEWRSLSIEEGEKPALSDEQVMQLSELVVRIESHYGFPCDIEWAFEAGSFFITQSRPITTLSRLDQVIPSTTVWERVSARKTTVHRYFDFSEASDTGLMRLIGDSMPESMIVSDMGEVAEYQPAQDIARFNASLKVFLNNSDNISRIRERMNSESLAFIEWLKTRCGENVVAGLSNVLLRELLLERHSGHINLVVWQWLGFSGKYVFDSLLEEVFARYSIDRENGLRIVYSHEHPIHAIAEDLAIKKIAVRLQTGQDISDEVETHLAQYRGLYMYDETYVPMSKEGVLARVRSLSTDANLSDSIRNIEQGLVSNSSEFFDLLCSREFSERDQLYMRFAHEYAEFMELRNTYRGSSALYSRDLFAEIGKRLDLSLDEVLAFSDYEIAELLNHPRTESKQEAQLRLQYALFHYDRGSWKRLNQSEAHAVEMLLRPGHSLEVSGTPAFKASAVRGRVRIVNAVADMHKLQTGDILVSSMTRPEFIMSIERAAAIITDEGGTLCHAAIVSRELRKPCIIGTKIATQVLKDGDMVEVDADNGIVKKIVEGDKTALVYTKQYTRDTTLIIQQAWCTALDAHRETLGMSTFGDQILTLHYLHNGVIEIWEHPTWTQALMDTMLAINAASDDTFRKNIAEHAAAEALLRPFWEKGVTDSVAELQKVLDIVFTKMYFFDWMYYPSLDARTPQSIKDVVIPLREKDTYFDQTDRFIRKSLVAIYPHLAGYEQAILRSEIAEPPRIEVLKRRCERFVVVGEHECYEGDLTGFQASHPGIEFRIEQPVETGALTGQTGCAGLAAGPVRIMLRKAEVPEMQEGEVLVSCMTTPDFTPAMQKAAAIVTDEGGIMCHAAIVARELGTPCLIGTRFATQTLKNGDIVEVDATHGIVRVLAQAPHALVLTKQYERERPLIYMMLWHETDRDGCRMFTGQSITHALQIVPPEGQAATVWYVGTEIADIEREALAKINADPALRARMIAHTKAAWTKIEPYLRREKSCSTVPEFIAFYRDVCSFWYAMTTPYFNLPNNEGLDAGFKQDILRIRDMTQEYSQQMAGLLEETFRHVLPEYARYSSVIAPEEIEHLSHGRDEQLIQVLDERMREGAFIYQSRVYPMSRLQEALDANGLVFEAHDTDVSELSGAIAYRGVAQGPVRVIRGRKDLERLQAGDVLVSVLTEPDYVAAMQKAAAIVTDEGGIMSHAAIVARELQKPCIIGTRSATAVLKDGDMVEVDAERGIVRKI